MKLKPGERSILASFEHGPDAEAALKALKQEGFEEAQMDRIGKFGVDPDNDMQRPGIAGNETSMAAATLDPAALDDDSRVLLAATPEASGLSGGSTMFEHRPFLVTVVTTEQQVDDAVRIINEHGGRV